MRVIAFGVRPPERIFFTKNNINNYDLQLESGNLNSDTMTICKGFNAVIVRASDTIDEKVIAKLKNEYHIKYILTRTAGTNHLDLAALKKYQVLSARVPGYSPTAISELALAMAMAFNRKVWPCAQNIQAQKYLITNDYFAREINNSKVGIIGVGKIGLATAKLFKALNAEVLGYDKFQNPLAQKVVKFVDLATILAQSDILILHMPYIKGENENFINKKTLSQMKDTTILINVARGEIIDEDAVYDALIKNKLAYFGADTLKQEALFFNKKEGKPLELHQKLINLKSRVIITNHIGSYTDQAVNDMVSISYQNLEELVKNGKCKNQI